MNAVHPAFAQAIRWIAPPSLPKRSHSRTTEVEYAGMTFTVAYDYTAAERAVFNADSPLSGPGHPASVKAYEIKLGEHDLVDHLARPVIEAIEQIILEQLGES